MNSQIQIETRQEAAPIVTTGIDTHFSLQDLNKAHGQDFKSMSERMRQIRCSKKDDLVFECWSIAMIALTVISTIASMVKMAS